MKKLSLLNALMIVATFYVMAQSQPGGKTTFVNSSDGVRIAYEVHGEGKTALVLVHGWSCDRSYWKNQIEKFSQGYKVVTLDLAGHGESGLERKDWTMQAFGKDVAAVADKLGLQHIILIGHSMGGDVIAEAARNLQGKVLGMVMVDTYHKLGTGRSPQQVEAFIATLRKNFSDSTRILVRSMFLPTSDATLVEQVAADMSSAPPEVALSSLEHAFSYSRDMPHTLGELKLPVIAINSGSSPTDTASMKRYGVDVIVMPNVGHFLMLEDPDRFNQLLNSAIDKLVQN